jgi:segregation and condensation protein A
MKLLASREGQNRLQAEGNSGPSRDRRGGCGHERENAAIDDKVITNEELGADSGQPTDAGAADQTVATDEARSDSGRPTDAGAADQTAAINEASSDSEARGAGAHHEATQEAPTLVRRPVYEVSLEAFEGPLDLLLHLIREHEIDIYDIPIASITNQYLEYLGLMESLDLALAGEFIEMAATLIRIKVRMLLPAPIDEGEEAEDPRAQLVQKLVEYREFKEAASSLSERELERRELFPHGIDVRAYRDLDEDMDTEEFLRDVTLFDLVDCLKDVLSRIPTRIDVHEVDFEGVTVEEEIERIRGELRNRGPIQFRQLFTAASTRREIITTFIALLELIRLGVIAAAQKRTFGEIELSLKTEG